MYTSTPHPPPPRPSTAAPGRRNLTSVAVTAAPPVTAAATRPVTAPVMVRFKKSDLRPLEPPNIIGSKALLKFAKTRRMWLSDQENKPLSPIREISGAVEAAAARQVVSPTPRMREAAAAAEAIAVVKRMALNRTPAPPTYNRPASSRNSREKPDSKVSGPNLGSIGGGRTRARKIGRKGRKGTNKRRRYIVAKTRRQRRGNN